MAPAAAGASLAAGAVVNCGLVGCVTSIKLSSTPAVTAWLDSCLAARVRCSEAPLKSKKLKAKIIKTSSGTPITKPVAVKLAVLSEVEVMSE